MLVKVIQKVMAKKLKEKDDKIHYWESLIMCFKKE